MNPDIAELLATGEPINQLAAANDHSWFPELQGFFSNREGLAYALAAEDRTVLEIGSWKGRSTMFAAATAKRIYAVDTWRGDDYAGRGWFFPEFEQNCREEIIAGRIVPVMCDFRDPLVTRGFGGCEVVLYDADHSDDAVGVFMRRFCYCNWSRLLMHDCDYDSERKAIAYLAENNLCRVSYADRLAVIAMSDDPIHSRLETRP